MNTEPSSNRRDFRNRTPQTRDRPDRDAVESHSTPWLSWLLVATLTALLTGVSTSQSLRRYQELRSGWSWDLAYYNQWFWALTHGDRKLTVRPDLRRMPRKGPSIWKMNYLAPIRLALVPLYRLAPGSASPCS